MFGLDAWVFVVLLAVLLIPVITNARKEYIRAGGGEVSFGKEDRKCLSCGYAGRMKTWLGNYNAPQFIALIGFLFFLIPGLIFIALFWGKYKCPSCGALGKNQPLSDARQFAPTPPPSETKKCPYCAETIKSEAVICRFCNRQLEDSRV